MSEITVGFAIYCSSCAGEIRTATPSDRQGDLVRCPHCQIVVECLVGVRVHTSDDGARERLKTWMNENAYIEDLMADILEPFHRPRPDVI